jgi:hypothetical protein
MNKKLSELANDINAQHDSRRHKIRPMLDFVRRGRKYGFPIVSPIEFNSDFSQLVWAARLILSITCPKLFDENVSNDYFERLMSLALTNHTSLFQDSKELIELAEGNNQQFKLVRGGVKKNID